jgi:hypothetical protein
MMRANPGLDDLTSEIPEAAERPLLVFGHEIGIAHHVSGKDSSETSLRRVIRRAAHGLSRTSTLKQLERNVRKAESGIEPAFPHLL